MIAELIFRRRCSKGDLAICRSYVSSVFDTDTKLLRRVCLECEQHTVHVSSDLMVKK